MSDQVKDYSLLYKWMTYILMFYVGMFFYYISATAIHHVLYKGYSSVFTEFDFLDFVGPVVMAFYACFFITIPMIIGVVVLIERYKVKWFKTYFLVTFLSSIIFAYIFGNYGREYDKILIQALVPCLFTQYVVWLFFNRVFDRLDKRYNLK